MNEQRRGFQVIPAVDVLDGQVVRLQQGDYERVTVYARDPVVQVAEWVAAGAELVHVVDLDGARSGIPDASLWERLADEGLPFQVGGGLRDAETARRALDAGAERVVMGTAAVWDAEVLAAVGVPDRVVAAVDVRGDRATGAGWLDEGRRLETVLSDLTGAGIRRVLATGISRDGTMEGPEMSVMRSVVAAGEFAVVASGGVGSIGDLQRLAALGCEAAIVGRALYEHRFTIGDAIAGLRG